MLEKKLWTWKFWGFYFTNSKNWWSEEAIIEENLSRTSEGLHDLGDFALEISEEMDSEPPCWKKYIQSWPKGTRSQKSHQQTGQILEEYKTIVLSKSIFIHL